MIPVEATDINAIDFFGRKVEDWTEDNADSFHYATQVPQLRLDWDTDLDLWKQWLRGSPTGSPSPPLESGSEAIAERLRALLLRPEPRSCLQNGGGAMEFQGKAIAHRTR